MKKYLMTAAAAILWGGILTSCTKEDMSSGGDSAAKNENIQKTYEEAFLSTFGRPVAGLDWGFSADNAGTRGMTRSNPGEDYPATSTGINANANEWADPNKYFGGWVVPDPLTEEQKAVVRAYFQANPNLTYEDPHFRHFFVQQVYKGGSAQAGPSSENITAANGSVYNSDNMNLLTVGENNQHINNFNSGNCSVNNTVLTNGGNVNDGPYHSDQIMLMVNIDDTSCFGYHETGSSTHHNNKMALVGWETIRTWANANNLNGECLNDGWNRSFIGFDLAIKEGAEAYDKNQDGTINYASYAQAPESPVYAWDGEKVVQITTGEYETVTVGNEWSTWTETRAVMKDEYKTVMNCGWLTTNMNFYVAAEKATLSQTISLNRAQISSLTEIQNCVVLKEVMDGDQWYQAVINLPKIKQLVDAGYLPVKDKNLTEWVKVGKSDGYFSDWIVTLAKADRISTTPDPVTPTEPADPNAVMVIAEDLSTFVNSSGKDMADFDFNDVVFEVRKGSGVVNIKLRAAGGTLPLTVGGSEGETEDNHGEAVLKYEVHRLFKVSTGTMVNTNSASSGATRDAVNFTVPYPEGVTSASSIYEIANAIPIRVMRNGSWLLIQKAEPVTSDAGSTITASKLAVDTNYEWCNERVHIDQKFPYIDAYGNNKGSRFRLYLNGDLRGKWWKEDTRM